MLRSIVALCSPIPKNLNSPTNVLVQTVRTTFILKRRYEPLLHKTNHKPKKMRAKYFIYDLVEHTLDKKRENVEVILKNYVEGVGSKGEIVSVKQTFAYNKLILPGLAVFKSDENIKNYARKEDEDEVDEQKHSSPFAQRTVNMIERMVLAVVMNKDEPWTIEPWHIRASLRKAGYQCNEECIQLPEHPIQGPDLQKENKDFTVIITVNNLEKANLKCRIHHWSTDPSERLPYVFEHWKTDGEPVQLTNTSL